ncbi:MAG: hypothetical protein SPG81_07135, partial [Candidatus Egerieousia sp.]|nr:hypothetical protein [Candidatus Egerieousia sp.]
LCLMACNKVENPSNSNNLSAVASIDTQTKTVYTDNGAGNGMKVDWAESDSFTAYYNGTSTLTFSKSKAGSTFSAVNVPEGVTTSTQFTGVYGEAASFDGTTLTINFANQDGTFASLSKYDVMSCSSSLNDNVLTFAFKHQCAILRMTVRDYYGYKQPNDKIDFTFTNAVIPDNINATGFVYNAENIAYGMSDLSKFVWTEKDNDPSKRPYREAIAYLAVPPMTYKKGTDQTGVNKAGFDKFINLGSIKNQEIKAGVIYDVLVHNSPYGEDW